MTVWNSFRTDGQVGITTELTTYLGGNGDTIHAYIARPTSEGPHPGIVAVHHLPGWDEAYQEFAERFAKHGYVVIVPDLYCRYGHGSPDDVAAEVRAQGGVPDADVIADCEAAMQWLRAQPDSNGKVGIIGSCSGGRHALLTASSVEGFDAVVDLWGGAVVSSGEENPKRPIAPFDLTEQLSVPLLGIFGNDDKHPPPHEVDMHEEELKKHGKNYEFHRYDDAGHGFFYYHTGLYRPEQAMDAWEKIFAFFDKYLDNN